MRFLRRLKERFFRRKPWYWVDEAEPLDGESLEEFWADLQQEEKDDLQDYIAGDYDK